jgi:gamma-glutamyltranspeptidase/glutathione hydrolase
MRIGVIAALALVAVFKQASTHAEGVEDGLFHKHVVVCQEGNAADAGRDVLRKGGNAVDAAVATAFALAVTHPAAGNLGGGGFLIAYDSASKRVLTFDFRELAPAAATERMYLDSRDRLLPLHRAGARAAAVPGTVRGLAMAHSRLGKLPWSDLLSGPARLAREGFLVTPTLAKSLNGQLFLATDRSGVPEDLGPEADRMADFPSSVAAFRKPDGTPWAGGDRLVQRDLADTLDRIAAEGPDGFYKGKTADLIVDYMTRNMGLITLADLARYQARAVEPLHRSYRGHEVYGMAPPSSGGIVILQALAILDRYDLKADGATAPRTLHRVAEAMRRAYFTRATQIADPAFVDIDAQDLISDKAADRLASSIGERATPSASLADFPIEGAEGQHTTHLSTFDGQGNAVALTYTLEEGYGSKAVVAGAGFLLNNEMGDFNLIPGRTDVAGRIGTKPNRIQPGKRMISSMAPTLVLKDGKVRLVTGSPGGRTIPNTTLWILLNVLEFGRSPVEAVLAPRTHHQWFPDVLRLEGNAWPEATLADLRSRGHKLQVGGIQGDAHTIIVDDETGLIHGIPDPRRQISKASGD